MGKSTAGLIVLVAALVAGLQLAQAGTVADALASPERPAADRERDARDHPGEILALLQLREGDVVADIFAGGGYYSELIGRVVAPGGKVYLQNNAPYLEYATEALATRFDGRDVRGVERLDSEAEQLGLGVNTLDAALIVMSYHDLYYGEEGWPAIDREDFMGQIVAALKPGGRFLIVDHAARKGAGLEATHTLHRIEESVARRDIEAAGLSYIGGTEVLRNPQDDRSLQVFDPVIRGKTDRFVLLFEKPED
ncbi:class I SAM-dependent methyltransferase [Parahaliea aestuarii]|uniref:Class I SAM-dependent methyltransferase n=1 Tax=Parahaliea aestuarii TaxID=1852021 RepID=A0A5C8ZRK9_9GAMM|nr:class I SAM-dependent methyltransferase [Parahaliea aestuarii]TXS89991.1 class I SAM-dependent methyltransferase [Parahaliea aestuarii]